VDLLETVKEKIAYLRGVIDGESAPEEGRSSFLFSKVLQILDQLAADVEELKKSQEELDAYLQEVDFDLAYLEDEFFGDDGDDDDDYDSEEWEEEPEESFAEAECPQCGCVMRFDEDFLFDEGIQIRCQRCGAVVFETDDLQDLEEAFNEDTEPAEDKEE